MGTSYIDKYMEETVQIVNTIPRDEIAKGIEILKEVRDKGGRLFILGVGGSAANASHAVNDFRKIGKIETYAPTDNVSELTARTNDEGWEPIVLPEKAIGGERVTTMIPMPEMSDRKRQASKSSIFIIIFYNI